MLNTVQWRNTPEGASGSSTTNTRLWVPLGRLDHVSGGEISAPSQVYCAAISPPGGIAGLVSIKGIVVSALPAHCCLNRKRTFDEEVGWRGILEKESLWRRLSEIGFRQGPLGSADR